MALDREPLDEDPALGLKPPSRGTIQRVLARVRRLRALTALSLRIERVWLASWPAGGVFGVFLALSFLNAWAGAEILHLAALMGVLASVAVALWRARQSLRSIAPEAVSRRLEQTSGLVHRPLATLRDGMAGDRDDPVTQALWRAHQARAFDAMHGLKAGAPRVDLSRRDPFALRYLVLLLVGATAILAGDQAGPRLVHAFTPRLGGSSGAAVRIDAWIDPPPYTNTAPIALARDRGDVAPVPAGAALVIRVQGVSHAPKVRLVDQSPGKKSHDLKLARRAEGIYEGRQVLTESVVAELKTRWRTLAQWTISVTPDQPPAIAFAAPPRATAQHSVRIDYTLADDFGVTGVTLRIKPKDAPASVPAFDVAMPMPEKGRTEAVLHAYKDLTAHRWAGLDVVMQLVAQDAMKQQATSAPVEFTLPERPFRDPLAKALIAARKALVRDPWSSNQVASFLDAVTNPPVREFSPLSIYLGLRSVYWRLRETPDRDAIEGAIDQLWDLAIAIDDGVKGKAKSDLRAAREALSKALAEGAGQDEIARRIAELKAALDRYVRAQASQMQADKGPTDPRLTPVTPDALMGMLDQLEQLAQQGSTDAAEALMREVDDILENLRTEEAQAPDPNSPEARQAEALSGLSKLMRDQRALMDDTFRQSQTMPFGPDGEGGASQAPNKSDKTGKLAERQEGLRQQLDTLNKALMGAGSGGSKQGGPPALGQAQRAMQAARDALKEGQTRHAVERQKEALEALRNGAQSLAQAMQGSGMGRAGGSASGNIPNFDPLGRPNAGAPDLGQGVAVPTKADLQKAREILDEIRRRAGELDRPAPERDYLDRLLERFH